MTESEAQYLATALWSSTDDAGDPLDDVDHAWDTGSLLRMLDDWRAFSAAFADLIAGATTQAAHDFWLTRNGHGAGFWDGDWPEPGATTLTQAAHAFGEVDLYIGDDGLIYVL